MLSILASVIIEIEHYHPIARQPDEIHWSGRSVPLYYERLLASQDRTAVELEAVRNVQALGQSPYEFVRDPVLLEFLG